MTVWDKRIPKREKDRSGEPSRAKGLLDTTLSETAPSVTEREQNDPVFSIPRTADNNNASPARGAPDTAAYGAGQFFYDDPFACDIITSITDGELRRYSAAERNTPKYFAQTPDGKLSGTEISADLLRSMQDLAAGKDEAFFPGFGDHQ